MAALQPARVRFTAHTPSLDVTVPVVDGVASLLLDAAVGIVRAETWRGDRFIAAVYFDRGHLPGDILKVTVHSSSSAQWPDCRCRTQCEDC